MAKGSLINHLRFSQPLTSTENKDVIRHVQLYRQQELCTSLC